MKLKVIKLEQIVPGNSAIGYIYGDTRGEFEDGTCVRTSTIVEKFNTKEGVTVIRTRNSAYELEEVSIDEWIGLEELEP